MVRRLVLLTEDGAADDTADATEADERGRAESTLPLSSDVVRLPGENAGDVGVGGGGGNEDAEVASADILHVSEESDTWCAGQRLEKEKLWE